MNTDIKKVKQKNYKRIIVKTHWVEIGEDLKSLVKKYVLPKLEEGDWFAISEKVVSVCASNVRHISTIEVGFLAKLLVRGVKKYPNDIGYSRPEKMQVAVETAGRPRIVFAALIGGFLKLFGITGVFWKLAGNQISEIDGFVPDAPAPYDEYVVLPPNNPQQICQEMEDEINYPCAIIDGNNINVEVIAKSKNLSLTKEKIRLILLDNPMGQEDESTPFVIIRE